MHTYIRIYLHTYIQGAYVVGASLGFMVYCLRKDAPAACMLCEPNVFLMCSYCLRKDAPAACMLCERILWYVLGECAYVG
jgi:hypothetical protein